MVEPETWSHRKKKAVKRKFIPIYSGSVMNNNDPTTISYPSISHGYACPNAIPVFAPFSAQFQR